MNFIADENFPTSSIRLLEQAGYIVLDLKSKHSGITDSEVLELASLNDLVILTFDKDFGDLLFRDKLKAAGIVLFRIHPFLPDEPGKLILDILNYKIKLKGHFTVISKTGVRQKPI